MGRTQIATTLHAVLLIQTTIFVIQSTSIDSRVTIMLLAQNALIAKMILQITVIFTQDSLFQSTQGSLFKHTSILWGVTGSRLGERLGCMYAHNDGSWTGATSSAERVGAPSLGQNPLCKRAYWTSKVQFAQVIWTASCVQDESQCGQVQVQVCVHDDTGPKPRSPASRCTRLPGSST